MGVLAPAGTPRDIIEAVHQQLRAVLRDPGLLKRLEADGVEPVGTSPAEFDKLITTELRQWAELVKRANIKAE